MRVLIMGLPGAGKTTLAMALKSVLETEGYTIAWYNADVVRKKYNDWTLAKAVGCGKLTVCVKPPTVKFVILLYAILFVHWRQ